MFKIDQDVSEHIQTHEGANGTELPYLPWAAGLGLAGRPAMSIVEFEGGNLSRSIFGGAAVAVELDGQRVYLPVQDGSFHALDYEKATARDIGDAHARCRTKAIAICTGIGLSLYAGFKGDGPAFAKAVGDVTPTMDLVKVPPMVSKKSRGKGAGGNDYVKWAASIAAAKLADESFRWTIEEREFVNTETGEVRMEPYTKLGTGYAVGVTVTFKGATHTEWLPILGIVPVQTKNGTKKLDNQPLLAPTVSDWNKSVMRCLSKAVAVATGYGLSVYAKFDFTDSEQGVKAPSSATADKAEPAETREQASPVAAQAASAPDERATALVREFAELADRAGVSGEKVLAWVGVRSIDKASDPQLAKVRQVLNDMIAKAGGDASSAAALPSNEGALKTLIDEVLDLARKAGVSEGRLCAWMGVKTLGEADEVHLKKVRPVLRAKLAKGSDAAAA